MSNNFDFNLKGTSFNTLDRDLSIRVNHPDNEFNISNNKFPVFDHLNKQKEFKQPKEKKEEKNIKQKNNKETKKSKYITTEPDNFKDFYSFGVKYGQNYNTDQESDLLYSEATRTKQMKTNTKESSEYWDNTKRRNLDTSVYTNNPTKIQGRGFGNVSHYDNLLNGIGLATRGENPERNPRSVEDDRIFLTNHNYNYDKYHTTDMLPCGSDTRYLNKKMI